MYSKDKFSIEVVHYVDFIGKYLIDYKKLTESLYDAGFRKLTPNEIQVLEMLENGTPIEEIERYRNEEL